ncbi:MAG: methyltransferase domain-containing protein, partial [Gammaproteobacteria bacterium]
DPDLLEILPDEIRERDYGCGDPSRHVQPGDTVLDLGCGGGKICYMAAQLAGPEGEVIGIDMNDDMLALARKYQPEMEVRLGGCKVRFLKGYIEDLALDLEAMSAWLKDNPVHTPEDLARLEAWSARQRREAPLVADESVDLVISNCVLNLVDEARKPELFREIFRVLRPGGRIAISDIVSDSPVPEHLKKDPALWSGCISGSLDEESFIGAFVDAGFAAVNIEGFDERPWQVVDDIEFRSVTITAIKPEAGECLDYGHAVIYRGPFSEVRDDEGHVYPRGARIAVCERTYRQLMGSAYRDAFIGIAPPDDDREPATFCQPAGTRRSPQETRRGVVHGGAEGCCC